MVRKPQGMTLPEVLVVAVLILGMMGIVSAYFIQGQRYNSEIGTYASVQRNATDTLARIIRELNQSTSLYSQTNTGNGVLFLSFGPTVDGDPPLLLDPTNGKIIWRKWVAILHDIENQKLLRVEVPLASATSQLTAAPAPEVPLDSSIQTLPEASRRPLAEAISAFQIKPLGRGFKISLTSTGTVPVAALTETQRKLDVSVTSTIAVQN